METEASVRFRSQELNGRKAKIDIDNRWIDRQREAEVNILRGKKSTSTSLGLVWQLVHVSGWQVGRFPPNISHSEHSDHSSFLHPALTVRLMGPNASGREHMTYILLERIRLLRCLLNVLLPALRFALPRLADVQCLLMFM